MDRSNGWDAIADSFIAARSSAGVEVIRRWAAQLPPAASVIDVGCGTGDPVTRTLLDAGLQVSGIDASPRLADEFRRRFPACPVACEAAEDSRYFDRTFDAGIAIGLVFLLAADTQETVLRRIASAVDPGGRILFSAPEQSCQWRDTLTGQASISLGTDAYRAIMASAGWQLQTTDRDQGGNHYFSFTGAKAPFIA